MSSLISVFDKADQFLVTLAAFATSLSYASLVRFYRQKRKYSESGENRINRLVTSLNEATEMIRKIEEDIKSRHELVEKLKNDVKRYEELSKLKQSEIEAIAQTVELVVKKESNKSFWAGVLVNALFFILGAFVSWLLSS